MCPYLFISLFLLAGRAVIAQAQPQPGQIPSIFETLRAYTCNNVIPAPPTNLVAVPKDAAIDFGWWPPTNRPCNVTYEVRAAPRSVSGTVSIATETKNTFITLSGLKNDVVYDITVLVRGLVVVFRPSSLILSLSHKQTGSHGARKKHGRGGGHHPHPPSLGPSTHSGLGEQRLDLRPHRRPPHLPRSHLWSLSPSLLPRHCHPRRVCR